MSETIEPVKTTILPRWSKRGFRQLIQGKQGGGRGAILHRHVHEILYDVLEGIVARLVRGFAMERQTCPAAFSDVDVVEHVVRYDTEMQNLLPDLARARERWNGWKQGGTDDVLKALPHYRLKTPLKRAIRFARREMGTENPRVMMDLVAMFLLLVETWVERVAQGVADLAAVTHRRTVRADDIALILRLLLSGQEWVVTLLQKERKAPTKSVDAIAA
jgi:histone H3/H4